MRRKKDQAHAEGTIPAGYTVDYVSVKQVKETPKELVRQRIVRALIHEYGFSPEDMELDFSRGNVTLNPGFKVDSGAVSVAQAYNDCTAGSPQLPQLGKMLNADPFAMNAIILYPNPTSGMIHIQHDEKLAGIQIFDMVGKIIINQKCQDETETNIDLTHLPNGVYHGKAPGYQSIKVIKNH